MNKSTWDYFSLLANQGSMLMETNLFNMFMDCDSIFSQHKSTSTPKNYDFKFSVSPEVFGKIIN